MTLQAEKEFNRRYYQHIFSSAGKTELNLALLSNVGVLLLEDQYNLSERNPFSVTLFCY